MAKLYIAEFDSITPTAEGGAAQIARSQPIIEQTVAISGVTAQSAAFNAATKFIRVHTDAICSIAISANPTATVANMRMAADQTEYFGITAGQKVAVISNT